MINSVKEYIRNANKKELEFLLCFYNEIKEINNSDPISVEIQFAKIEDVLFNYNFVNPEKYLLNLIKNLKIINYDSQEKIIRIISNDYKKLLEILEIETKNIKNFNNDTNKLKKHELISILKYIYDNAPIGYQMTMVHLFGIEYADDLENQKIKDIALAATQKEFLYVEIGKGIKIAKYLKLLKDSGQEIYLTPPKISLKNTNLLFNKIFKEEVKK